MAVSSDDTRGQNESMTLPVLGAHTRNWIDQTLWAGTPPTRGHLSKLNPNLQPITLQIPIDLLDDGVDIEAIEIIGVPDDAEIRPGENSAPNIWRVEPSDIEHIALIPASATGGTVDLIIKVVGVEKLNSSQQTNMASVRVNVPEPLEISATTTTPKLETESMPVAPKSPPEAPKRDVKPVSPPASKEAPVVAPKPTAKRPAETVPPSAPPVAPKPDVKPVSPPASKEAPVVAPKPTAKRPAETVPPSAPPVAPKPDVKPVSPAASKEAPVVAPKPPAKRPAESVPPSAPPAAPKPDVKPVSPTTPKVARPSTDPKLVVDLSRAQEKPPTVSPAHQRLRTGEIALRLGGAPEYGDPLYRISVDGCQIATGNVDWGLGLPDLSEGEDALICWQKISIPWDFEDCMPNEIVISYENEQTSRRRQSANLVVEWLNVDGLVLAPKGQFARATDGYSPWPLGENLWSWSGDLVFDVAGACAGIPSHHTKKEENAVANQDENEKGRSDAPKRPLIIHVSEKDIQDTTIMDEFRALRAYLQGEIDLDDEKDKFGTFSKLGLEEAGWQDLILLGPDGNAVSLDPGPAPFVMRLAETDSKDPVVLNRLAGLRAYLSTYEQPERDLALDAEFGKMGIVELGWRELLVLDHIGRPVALPEWVYGADVAQPEGEDVAGSPSADIPSADIPSAKIPGQTARTIRDEFWARVLKRGVEGMEKSAAAQDSGEHLANNKNGTDQIITRKDARHKVQAFYSGILKRALDRLQDSTGENTLAQTPVALRQVPDDGLSPS